MLGRSLLMKASGSLLLYPAYVQEFLDRRTAADVAAGNTQGLERAVTDAFNVTLQDMVADGSLGVSGNVLSQAASLIKAGVPMMGARTLSGALVPLAADMPAPTNFNFVTGDYNRRTGIKGDGVAKHLNSNRNNNADPQNNRHISVWVSTAATATVFGADIGAYSAQGAGNSYIGGYSANEAQVASSSAPRVLASSSVIGFRGVSRSLGEAFLYRDSGSNKTVNQFSVSPLSRDIEVFRGGVVSLESNARLNFYSIGESLDLAALDARITALSNAIQAAIAP